MFLNYFLMLYKYFSDPSQAGFTFPGDGQWPTHAGHYSNYLGHTLQTTAFSTCPQIDVSPHDSGHATPQATPTGRINSQI